MFGLERIFAVYEGVGHTKGHAAVISPYPYLSGTGVDHAVVYGYDDIFKSIVDDAVALFIVG